MHLFKIFKFLIIFSCFNHNLYAQKRIGVFNVNAISSKSQRYTNFDSETGGVFSAVPTYCVDFFSNSNDFITIDRKNQSLIGKEIELQKSENFMDGFVVNQNKSEGIDLICQSVYDVDTYTLIIKIIDVKEEKILCTVEKKLDKNFWGIKDLKQQVTGMLIELNSKCFEVKIPFVKVLETKNNKAKTALIAGGSDLRIKKDYKFEIFRVVEEKVGNKIINRNEIIGQAVVTKVEDENFSIIKLVGGEEEIMTATQMGTQLFCKILTK